MVTDPIADLLVRLRNARATSREKILVPHSVMKRSILEILQREQVLSEIAEKLVRGKKVLEVSLNEGSRPQAVPEFVRVSTPGRRIYVKAKNIPRPLRGYGLVVLSTPQGIMTGREARKKGVGGEVLFKEI